MKYYLALLFACLLTGCTTSSTMPLPGQEAQQALHADARTDERLAHQKPSTPQNVNAVLLPPLSVQTTARPTHSKRFDISVKDLPAKDFFMGLVSGTKYNMLVDAGTTEKITLQLKHVTIDEALDAVHELYGYEYRKTTYGYEVLPPKMITQIFSINYLNIKRVGQSRTQLVSTELTDTTTNSNSQGQPQTITSGTGNTQQTTTYPTGSGSTVITKAEDDFWENLKTTLQTLVGNEQGRWLIVNPQASVVMVHAYPKELHEVGDYLDTIQGHLQRQVIIEAKILEVRLSDQYQAGIDWKVLTAHQLGATHATDLSSDFNGGLFSMALTGHGGDFTSVINLLEQQGNVQTLSSPHISTVNNQEAVIKVGEDEFFVTGYTSNITPSGSSSITSQSVQLNPFFSGITLDVTPQIGDQDDVTLYIHPSISTVTDQNKTIQLSGTGSSASNLTLPLAKSTIRESDNVVRARNGQIIVIGGLMQNLTEEQIAATPWLSKIPFVGTLARNTYQTSTKIELVILLKPVVVGTHTWAQTLQDYEKNLKGLHRGYHFGSRPSVFGTQAEAHP